MDKEIKDLENEEIKEDAPSIEKEDKKASKKEKKEKKDAKDIEIDNLKKDKAELEAKYNQLKDDYVRLQADTLNFKKRLEDEDKLNRKYASQGVVGNLLHPVDMLNKIVNMPTDDPNVKNYQIGFQMISKQLMDILEAEGLKHFDSLGKDFDPKYMNAVEVSEDKEKKENIVLKVLQEGYMYKDRVLRPSMVVVNKYKKEENKEDSNKEDSSDNEKEGN